MPTAARSFSQLIDVLSAGNRPTAIQITALSDLDRDEVAKLREAWGQMPEVSRVSLIARADELAADNAELHFVELARIGLRDTSAAVRRQAAKALGESDDRRIAHELADVLLHDPDDGVRAEAATALAVFVVEHELRGSTPMGEEVVAALQTAASAGEASLDVRARAIESLGPCSRDWVEPMISDAYFQDDRRMQIAAIRAMGASANEEWLHFLDEQAHSDDPEFRHATALALGAIASEDGIEQLADLLADEDPGVTLAAITALGEVGGEVALQRLRTFAEAAPPEFQEAIDEAIEAASFTEHRELLTWAPDRG
jgi:HEAT repeat protein